MKHAALEKDAGETSDRLGSAMQELLATSIKWLLNTEEMDRSYARHKAEIERLSALTDEELSALGISRAEITIHAFRDVFEA